MAPVFEGPTLEDVVITSNAVEMKLKELNPCKSPGPDQIHPRVLKELACTVSIPLSQIFRKSLDSGEFTEAREGSGCLAYIKEGKQ